MFTLIVIIILGMQAGGDALCTIATLFNVPQPIKSMSTLYADFFQHSYLREDPLVVRLLTYTIACVSIVRAMAVFNPFNTNLMFTVSILYLYETLICMYEMDTSKVANVRMATRVAKTSLFMCVITSIHATCTYLQII